MPLKRFARPLQYFLQANNSGPILLFAGTLVALSLANSRFQVPFFQFWHNSFWSHDLHFWIGDVLMTPFFLLVGLEIRRELSAGELSTRAKASLPINAAIGGMLVPALIYALFNSGGEGWSGWGIPMATDIAFALGLLRLLGEGIPPALYIFLTALAIIDDLGAILVIGLFYTRALAWLYAVTALGVWLGLKWLAKRTQHRICFLLGGFLLWLLIFKSGLHPTVAGVLMAFAVPGSFIEKWEHALAPWVNLLIMPAFALANAGVALLGQSVQWNHPVTWGIVVGLVIGKQIGVTLSSYLAVRMGISQLPGRTSWGLIYGTSCLSGIGFTMSLFIATLAFQSEHLLAQAKLGILLASLLSGTLGVLIIKISLQRKATKY